MPTINLTVGSKWVVPNNWNNSSNTVTCNGGATFNGGGSTSNLSLTPGSTVNYVLGGGSVALFYNPTSQPTIYIITDTSVTNFPVPDDWNSWSNSVETVGAGGGGMVTNGSNAPGPGGGGAAYSKTPNLALTPNTNATLQVGIGGTGGAAPTAGGDTWFNGASLGASSVGAKGGGAPAASGTAPAGGVGGAAASGVGSIKNSGGDGGGTSNTIDSGSGGGGAGTVGEDGQSTSTSSGARGGNNAAGAGSGAGGGSGAAGTDGTLGGGGGGGGTGSTGAVAGGRGGAGQDWDASHGAGGGGGGGGGSTTSASAGKGGDGGLYGGGGGGSGYQNTTTAGAGAQGIIVITNGSISYIKDLDTFQFLSPPTRVRGRSGALARQPQGNNATFTVFTPVFPSQSWFENPYRRPLNRAGAIQVSASINGVEAPKINFVDYAWPVQPWQPPHPFHEKRSGALARQWYEDSIFSIFRNFFDLGFVVQPWQPPHYGVERKGTVFARGDDGIEDHFEFFISAGRSAQSWQPPHRGVERKGGIFARGDDGVADQRRVFRSMGFFVQPWQPPRLRALGRPGAIMPWTDIPPPFIRFRPYGWEIASPQPPHPRPEKRSGAYAGARNEDGVFYPVAPFYVFGFENQPPQPPRPRVIGRQAAIAPLSMIPGKFEFWRNRGWEPIVPQLRRRRITSQDAVGLLSFRTFRPVWGFEFAISALRAPRARHAFDQSQLVIRPRFQSWFETTPAQLRPRRRVDVIPAQSSDWITQRIPFPFWRFETPGVWTRRPRQQYKNLGFISDGVAPFQYIPVSSIVAWGYDNPILPRRRRYTNFSGWQDGTITYLRPVVGIAMPYDQAYYDATDEDF